MKSTTPIEILFKIKVKCKFKTEIKVLSNEKNHFPSEKIQKMGEQPIFCFHFLHFTCKIGQIWPNKDSKLTHGGWWIFFNHSFPLTNYSINKYSPNLNHLDKNCECSEFFQTLSSDVREDLRPSLMPNSKLINSFTHSS